MTATPGGTLEAGSETTVTGRRLYLEQMGLTRRYIWRLLIDSAPLAAGVTAIILALAVSQGAHRILDKPAVGLDRRVVVVDGIPASSTGVESGLGTSSLTATDVTALGNSGFVPDGLAVAPTVGNYTAVSELSRTVDTDVIGSTNTFASVLGYSIQSGRFITPADLQSDTAVVVLGQTVVDSLFAGDNPVGQYVVISNQTFQVIGTFAPRGYSGAYNQDNLAVLPITTAWKTFNPSGNQPIDQVLIQAATPKKAKAVAKEAKAAMLQTHNIIDPALANFSVVQQSQLVAVQVQAAQAVRRLLEVSSALFFIIGFFWLVLFRAGIDPIPTLDQDAKERIQDCLIAGTVASTAGLAAAAILAPFVRHLAANVPTAHLTVLGMLSGPFLALAVSANAVLPAIIRRDRRA
jgi:hypothetical protein